MIDFNDARAFRRLVECAMSATVPCRDRSDVAHDAVVTILLRYGMVLPVTRARALARIAARRASVRLRHRARPHVSLTCDPPSPADPAPTAIAAACALAESERAELDCSCATRRYRARQRVAARLQEMDA